MNQRKDYTFKYNEKIGRHGWLRLTPAYSIKLVQDILCYSDLFSNKSFQEKTILDPFCGTATTGIVAAELGLDCILYDINPFLVWFGNIKSKNFNTSELKGLYDFVSTDLENGLFDFNRDGYWVPPMKNIERWWNDDTLFVLSALRNYICFKWGVPSHSGNHNLLWVAFARLVIETSAADFSHISVSFKEKTAEYTSTAIINLYLNILEGILHSATSELKGRVAIIHGDSRTLNKDDNKVDLVITSPPYPNRISYIRELRPYMYWLGFLETGEQAGELDWKAIGGTWGSATSKLFLWESENKNLPQELFNVCSKIEHTDNKNGKTMSLYVLKFFEDMFTHLSNLRNRLNNGAEINYILGNSSFYGNYVDTDSIVKDILYQLNYSEISSCIIRKRNCNKGLFEYKISAKWNN
jgi:hypothetical protein